MPEYHAHRLAPGGIVIATINLTCRDDLDALREAERIAEGCRVVLWNVDENRLVEGPSPKGK